MSENGFSGLAVSITTVVGTLLGAFGGSYFTYINQSRELDIRMVDVALTILSAKQREDNNQPARRFAVKVLNEYSGISISATEAEDWIVGRNGFPIGRWPAISAESPRTRDALIARGDLPKDEERVPSEAIEKMDSLGLPNNLDPAVP